AVVHGAIYREVAQAVVRNPQEWGYVLLSIEGAGVLFRDVTNFGGKLRVVLAILLHPVLAILLHPVIIPRALGDAVPCRASTIGWVLGVGGAFAANDVVDDRFNGVGVHACTFLVAALRAAG